MNANLGGLRAQAGMQSAQRALQTSLERLSTGLRINRSEDDAAGLMLRDRFGAQVHGLEEGIRNIQAARGLVQVAEQGINKVTEALQRIRSLAVRAADDGLNDDDRGRIQEEIRGLLREINERAESTAYNGKRLLDGSIASSREARGAAARVQSNAILAQGGNLLSDATITGDAANVADAVSQGSYEVRVVRGGGDRTYVSQTTRTVLGGKAASGLGYLNSKGVAGTVVNRTETVVDREGNKHDVSFTFTSTGRATWDFSITGSEHGAWTTDLATSGTIAFDEYSGALKEVLVTSGQATSRLSSVVQTIGDGTSVGQKWTIDFSRLRNIAHPPTNDTPVEPANGTTGATPTTEVTFNSQLDSGAAVGFRSGLLGQSTWVDRAGFEHDVGFVFTKVIDDSGLADVWEMEIQGLSGKAWTGQNVNDGPVRVRFDASGALVAVNEDSTTDLTVLVGDGTSQPQAVVVHMANLTSGTTPSPSGVNHISATANGSSTIETGSVVYSGLLDRDNPSTLVPPYSFTLSSGSWIDRLGYTHATTTTFTKSGTNEWAYTVQGLDAGHAWTGQTNGAEAGKVIFDDTGALTNIVVGSTSYGTGPVLLKLGDGTVDADGDPMGALAGQDVYLSFNAITQPTNGGPGDTVIDPPTADGTATAPGTTSTVSYAAVLDSTQAVGSTHSASFVWYDRNGTGHTVAVQMVKTADASGESDLADTWSYSFTGLSTTGSGGSGAPGVAWNDLLSGSATGSFTYGVDGNTTHSHSFVIDDGTLDGQSVTIQFSATKNLHAIEPVTGVQDGSASAPQPTTEARFTGILDKDLLVSSNPSFTTQDVTWYDRLGQGHAVSMTFEKVGVNQWSYAINGIQPASRDGAWTGASYHTSASGTLTFSDAGALLSVKDSLGATISTSGQFSITVADDVIATDQAVTINLATLSVGGITQSGATGITQPGNGPTTDSTVSLAANTVQDGSNPPPGITTSASYAGTLDADVPVGSSTTANLTWYDRDGVAHDVLLTLTKSTDGTGNSGLADGWAYSLSSAAAGVWSGGLSKSGTLSFSTQGATSNISVNVADGTAAGQTVSVNLSSLLVRNATEIPTTTQNGQADPPDPTTTATFAGVLDKDLPAGSTIDSVNVNWVDRQGSNHAVRARFVKQSSPPTNTWSYSFIGLTTAGGAWLGAVNSGPSTGTVTFDDAGNLTAINGSAPASFSLAVRDDTYHPTLNPTGGQTVTVSLTGLTQPTNASTAQSTVSQTTNNTVNGSATPPGISTTSTYAGMLDASLASGSVSEDVTWYDRNGGAHNVTLTFTKDTDSTGATGLADTWSYTITGLTGSGTDADGATWSGALSGASGSVTFGSDGTLPATVFDVLIDDGTTAGQTVEVTLSSLRNLFPVVAPSGVQDGTATAPDPTTLVKYTGILDKDLATGATFTTVAEDWYDRLGEAHATSVTFTKTATNTWSYSVSGLTTAGGAWTGLAPGGNPTGTLVFNDDGTLRSVNGNTSATKHLVAITVADDVIGSDQAITLDFGTGSVAGVTESGRTGITQPGNGASGESTVSALAGASIDGDSTAPGITESASVSAVLSSATAVGEGTSSSFDWYDRNGVAHTVTFTLNKTANSAGTTGLADTWTYTFASATAGAWGSGLNATGTLSFGSNGKVSGPLSVVINDGTTGMQTVSVDVTGLEVRNPLQSLGGSQDVTTPVPPDPTTTAGFAGFLDADLLVGSSRTTASRTWYDRLGTGHSVSITFTKTAANTWSYSLNGLNDTAGPWTGGAATNGTGTLQFDASGALIAVNGSSTGAYKQVTVTVADDAGGQAVVVDFGASLNGNAGVTQPGDAADSTVAQAANSTNDGSASVPSVTSSASYSGVLDASLGSDTETRALTWYDRNGEAHTVTLTLTKSSNATGDSGLDDAWSYSFGGFTSTGGGAHGVTWSGLMGGSSSATGTLDFNPDGTLASPTSLTFKLGDGTAAGQTVSVSLAGLITRQPVTAPSGTQNVTTPVAPDPTTTAKYAGVLDGDQGVGSAYTTPAESWYDRLGSAHDVTITYTRTAANTWSYSLSGLTAGGAWTGGATNATGTLVFDGTGALVSVNGASTGDFKKVTVTVADDTTTDQAVTVDFGATVNGNAGLTQAVDGTDSTVSTAGNSSADGSASAPSVTSTASYTGVLDAAAGASPVAKDLTWYDRNGEAHTVTLTLSKSSNGTGDSGLDDSWSYSFAGFTSTGGGAHGVTWGGLMGGSSSATGTLDFNPDGTLASPTSLTFILSDGTASGQTVSVSLSSLTSRSTIAAPSGTQNVTTPVAPNPTTSAQYAGVLDGDQNVGTSYTTAAESWFDRLGTAHNVTITYAKTGANTWSYSLGGLTTAGGAWTGGAAANATGTLVFDGTGALVSVNGASTGDFKKVTVTVADDTTGDQAVIVDFGATVNGNAGLTQATDAADSTVAAAGSSSADGSASVPSVTSTASYSAVLDASSGAAPVTKNLTWYDRNGEAHTVTLSLTKSSNGTGASDLDDAWSYSFTGFTTTGGGAHGVTWTGLAGGSASAAGTLDFDSTGALVSPTSLAFIVNDGTAAGQTVNVSLSGLSTRSPITAPAGTQNVGTPVAPDPTTSAKYAALLDTDLAVGTVKTTATESWFDRLGTAHDVSISFTRTAANAWSYTVNGLQAAGGAWSGAAPTGAATGTLSFNASGDLIAVNGSSSGSYKQISLVVADDAGGQAVTVDFGATVNGIAGIRQTVTDADDTTVDQASNTTVTPATGTAPDPTTTASWAARLDGAAAVGSVVAQTVKWYDRLGQSHDATLTLTKSAAGKWAYALSGLDAASGAWQGAVTGETTGTLVFSGGVLTDVLDGLGASMGTGALAFEIDDDTTAGQDVSVSFAAIAEVADTQNGSATVPTPTTQSSYSGNLDANRGVGYSVTTAAHDWFDRLAVDHPVSVTFTKTAASTWSYSVTGLPGSGGAWDGVAAPAGTTGSIVFDGSGNVATVNGVAGSTVSITVADDTTTDQPVTLSFASLTQIANGTNVLTEAAITSTQDGSSATPGKTTTATFSGALSGAAAGHASGDSQSVRSFTTTFYDKTGTAHNDVTLTLRKETDNAGLGDVWSYTFSAAAAGVWTGGLSRTGTLTFNGSGAVSSIDGGGTGPVTLSIADGTGTTQNVSVSLSSLTSAAPTALSGSQSGGSATYAGTGNATVTGTLDQDAGGTLQASAQWFDRNGVAHTVTVEVDAGAATYSIVGLDEAAAGSAWNGTITAGATGSATGTRVVTIDDATMGGQEVTLDFTGLTFVNDTGTSTPNSLTLTRLDGGDRRSTAASFAGQLDADASGTDAGATRTVNATWYDRSGAAQTVTLTLTKPAETAGLGDTWNYTMSAPAGSMWSPFSTSGTLAFDSGTGAVSSITETSSSASVSGTTLTQTVTDTAGSYTVDVTFSGLTSASISPSNAVSGSGINGSATASDPTTLADYDGQLDANRGIGSGLTETLTWYDRIGEAHSVGVTFTRTAIDQWSYSFAVPAAAGAWDGTIADGTGLVAGTLTFDVTTGALATINGAAPAAFTVVVGDTTTDQTVTIDLTGLSQATNGTSSATPTVSPAVSTGADPTTTQAWAGRLDGGAPVGASTSQTLQWYDRLGNAHDVTLALTKSANGAGQADEWSFSLVGVGAAAGAWTGSVSGLTAGTLVFGAGGSLSDVRDGATSLGTGALTISIADNTTGDQDVAVSFTGLAAVADTQNGSATAPTPTTTAQYQGALDGDLAAGSVVTSNPTSQWFDRLGTGHTVYVQYTKTAENAWSYSLIGLPGSGGAWNGAGAPANASGTLAFNASGALVSVNGIAGNTTSVTVADDTGSDQAVTVSFAGLTQPTDGPVDDSDVSSAANTDINGSSASATRTTSASYSAHLDAAAAGTTQVSTSFSWYDRYAVAHNVTLRLVKDSDGASALADTWTYTFDGLTSSPSDGASWTAPLNASGTIVFDADGNVSTVNGTSTQSLSLLIADGTTGGQTVSVNLASVRNDGLTLAALDGSQNVLTQQASDQTDVADYNGVLDADLAVGSVLTTATKQWYDRNGGTHNVSVTFTKTATDAWSYSINGLAAAGAWTGSNSGAVTGTLTFSGGTLSQINGASPAQVAVTLGDGTTGGQSVAVDFLGITQPGNGPTDDTTANSTSNTNINGSNASPTQTSTASYSAHLDAAAAGATQVSRVLSWYDRNAVAHDVTLRLVKSSDGASALADTWTYTFDGLDAASGVWTGVVTGATSGTLVFDANGNLSTLNGVSTRSLSLVLGDDTTAGQTVTVSFNDLRNDAVAASPLNGTQDVSPQQASDQTDLADYNGVLDADLEIGSALTTATKQWFDRLGTSHDVSVTFTKTADDAWTYSINGFGAASGAWTGATGGAVTGTLAFSAGTLSQINGASPAQFAVTVADGTSGGQSVLIDFLGLSQPGNGPTDDTTANSASNTDINGSNATPTPTATATYSAHLDAAAAGATQVSTAFSWYDRNAVAHNVTLRLVKASDGASALGDTWTYTFDGLDAASGVWTGVTTNTTGTLVFDANGNLSTVNGVSTRSLSLNIGDGTTAGQAVTVSFDAVRNDALALAALDGTQDVAAQQASDQTDLADYNGVLDADLAPTSTLTTATKQWFDRLGTSHDVNVTFAKTADDSWTYTINGLTTAGGAWTGSAGGAVTGTLTFSGGALSQINGAAPAQLTVTVADGTTAGQAVAIDFLGLTQPGNGATDDSTVATAANATSNGSNTVPTITSEATYSAHLDSTAAAGAAQTTSFTWYDRKAAARTVTLDLVKTVDAGALADSWSYSFSGFSGTVGGVTWNGATGTSGTLAFDANGNPTTSSATLVIDDGTTAGQSVTFYFSRTVSGSLVAVQNDGKPDGTAATATLTALSDTQDGTATAPVPTTTATFSGNLDGDLAVGATLDTNRTAPDSRWFDRLGTAHDVYVTYRKLDSNQWAYTINGLTTAGGAWTGAAPTGAVTGTLSFNDAGDLVAVNGSSAAGFETFSIAVADDVVATDQAVTVSFAGVRQPLSGTPSTDTTINAAGATVPNGTATAPGITTTVDYSAHLDSTLAPGTARTTSFNWYDRNGDAHSVLLTLTKRAPDNALNDSWDYTITGLNSTGSGGVAWTGGTSSGGTLTFDAAGNLVSPASVAMKISDGTLGGQDVTITFSGIKNDAAELTSNPVTGTADGTGVAPGKSTTASYRGNLDGDVAVGTTLTSAVGQWYDRLGVGHDVYVSYTKTNTHAWSYSIVGLHPDTLPAGSAWDKVATPTGSMTGTLTFSDAGVLTTVNGASPAAFNITVSDDTVPNQTVSVSFAGLTQTVSGTPSNNSSVSQTVNGNAAAVVGGLNTNPGETSTSSFTAHLDTSAAVGTVVTSNPYQWYDRNGTSHDVQIVFTKVVNNAGMNDNWSYSFIGLSTGSPWSGASSGGTGTLTFDANGNPTNPTQTLVINDLTYNSGGSVRGQQITLSFTNVRNDALPDTTASASTVTVVSGSQNVAAPVPGPNAAPPDPTLNVSYSGVLDADLAVGATRSTDAATTRWYDRLGTQHTVNVTFTKLDTNQWAYSFNGLTTAGGAWTGAAPGGAVTGTLSFNENGDLIAVNGSSAAGFETVSISVADDVTATDQQVSISFAGLTQPGNGSTGDTTVDDPGASVQVGGMAAAVVGGLHVNPGMTQTATYDGHLNSLGPVGTSTSTSFSWFDRNGVAHAVTMTLTKTAVSASLDETWSYSLSSATAGVWTGGLGRSGTIVFGANGSVASVDGVPGRTGSVNISDGTLDGQTVTLDFTTTLRNDAGAASALTGTQNGSAVAPDPTLESAYQAVLDAEDAVGFSATSPVATWYDRLGVAHDTTVRFEKVATNEWTYTLNGLQPGGRVGAWTSLAPTGDVTGTLTFNDAGDLIAVNGNSSGDYRRFSITVADDVIGSDQAVLIDFTGLVQEADATIDQTDVDAVSDGTPFTHTGHVTFHSRMVSGQGPVYFDVSDIVDKTGMDAVPGTQVVFHQIRDTNQWQYNVVAPTTSGFTGVVRNGTGVVTFNDAGNLINGGSFVANFDDGTAEGQDVTFVLSALKMSRESDLEGTRTDGVAYSAAELNAHVYFSGASPDDGPLVILEDVGVASRTVSLGGVRFTVNRVTQDDVGLTSYVKVNAYQAATLSDNALEFQFGADEGETLRLGLSRMDVQSIFRVGGDYDYTSITLGDALAAQDLIGQVDDALDYVGGENLKAGQFVNNLDRLLTLQRQSSTSMAGALSLIQDADMAAEAMMQSRRSILLQSATAMTAQANAQNQFLLQLLR